jgi:copper resistance protein D
MATSPGEKYRSPSGEGSYVEQILDLYGFLSVLLRGLTLALESLTVGGVLFVFLIRKSENGCRRLLRWGALLLALVVAASTTLNALVLRSSGGDLEWSAVLNTSFVGSACVIVVSALLISAFAARGRVALLLVPAGLVIAGNVITSHAFGRIDGRPLAMAATALHHLATAAWIGGLPYLFITLVRSDEATLSVAARRFSRMAVASVLTLVGAGLMMTWIYVGSGAALYGTSYGVMLIAKVVLLGMLLVLGGSNFLLLRRQMRISASSWLRMRRSIEVEVVIGIAAILTAASLTSQPPARDLVAGRVSAQEIRERFTPRRPRLVTPPVSALAPATPLNEEESKRFGMPLSYVPGATYNRSQPADIEWSEYNHNWAGLCVLIMGVLAVIAQTRFGHWARHWPLGFMGLALFLLIRSDPENWPLGPRGFWESFQVAEVTQHRLFVVLIVLFALFEWRVARNTAGRAWYRLVFPAVCLAGGALLLTHTHALGNIKEELLAEISHTSIAVLAVAAGGARWLELRAPRRHPALGFLWAFCFVGIGLLLTFYRES